MSFKGLHSLEMGYYISKATIYFSIVPSPLLKCLRTESRSGRAKLISRSSDQVINHRM